jgi:hypothetical protein
VFKVSHDGYMGDPGHTNTRVTHTHACAADAHTCAADAYTCAADAHGPAHTNPADTDATSANTHSNR